MKINRFNLAMILGILPLFSLMSILILKLVYTNTWLYYGLFAILLWLNYKIVKKFWTMPKRSSQYGGLERLEIELPVLIGMDIYTSRDFDTYKFLNRHVELYSPLIITENNNLKLIISEDMYRSSDIDFCKVALTREYLKFKDKSTVKIVLRLIMPILIVINIILLMVDKQVKFSDYFNPFIYNFLMPFTGVIIFLITLLTWNNYISANEQKIDKILLNFFTVEQTVSYIEMIEGIEGSGEKDKYKTFNEHYAKQRIDKLKKAKR